MSDPCPPAFIRTAPPIEPGTPTAHSNPVRPAAAVRRASTGSATAEPAVHIDSRQLDAVGPAPQGSSRRRRNRRRRRAGSSRDRRPGPEGVPSDHCPPPPAGRPSTSASRRWPRAHRPDRSSAARGARRLDRALRGRRRPAGGARRGSTSTRRSSARRCCTSSGNDAMSPHPIEMQTSPSRSSLARYSMRSSRRGIHANLVAGCASSTALTTSLPVTPGIGVVPEA